MKKKLLILTSILIALVTVKVDALTNYYIIDSNQAFRLCIEENKCNTYTQAQLTQRGAIQTQSTVTLNGTTYYYDNDMQAKYYSKLLEKQANDAKVASKNTITAEQNAYCNKLADPLRFIGQIVKIFKIIVPIILIIFGIIDFGKGMIGDEKGTKEAVKKLIFRAISGVVIFLIPTIVYLVFDLVAGWSQMSGYTRACAKCVLNVDKCVTSSSAETITPNTGAQNVQTASEPSNN